MRVNDDVTKIVADKVEIDEGDLDNDAATLQTINEKREQLRRLKEKHM
jgi:transcription antitermination factor NusG